MFALAQSAFKPNKLLVKLLISKQAKADLMVSVIHSKSALETDSILEHLSVGLPLFKKRTSISSCSMKLVPVLPLLNTE